MSEIRFWYAAGACSLAPHILLHEVGVDFSGIKTAVTLVGAEFPDGFERINPKLRVPVIAIDDQIITEVPAITTVIAGLAPSKHLMGRDLMETARVYEWMIWLSGSLHGPGFGALWRPQRFSDDPAAHEGIAEKAMQTIRGSFSMIDEKIVGAFAVGDAFTAVDPYLYVFYRWGKIIGIDLDRDYPRFAALARTMASRPSFAKATSIENVHPYGL